jgi:hypothetical protein
MVFRRSTGSIRRQASRHSHERTPPVLAETGSVCSAATPRRRPIEACHPAREGLAHAGLQTNALAWVTATSGAVECTDPAPAKYDGAGRLRVCSGQALVCEVEDRIGRAYLAEQRAAEQSAWKPTTLETPRSAMNQTAFRRLLWRWILPLGQLVLYAALVRISGWPPPANSSVALDLGTPASVQLAFAINSPAYLVASLLLNAAGWEGELVLVWLVGGRSHWRSGSGCSAQRPPCWRQHGGTSWPSHRCSCQSR